MGVLHIAERCNLWNPYEAVASVIVQANQSKLLKKLFAQGQKRTVHFSLNIAQNTLTFGVSR